MRKQDLSFNKFYDLEKEFNLFALQFRGVNYWQLVRFGVHTELCFSGFNVSPIQGERSFSQEIVGAVFQACVSLVQWRKLKQADVLRIRPLVQLLIEGESNDRQYDYFSLDRDVRVTDVYALGGYGTAPMGDIATMASAEAKVVLWKVKRKLFGAKEIGEDQKLVLREFLGRLRDIYGVTISLDKLLGQIQYTVACYLYYRRSYLKLFKKISPKAVLMYPSYDFHMFPAIAACRELGIVSMELQHGEIVDHAAYWYEDLSDNGKILPDYFMSYGQWWVENIQLPKCMKPIAVGNPYLEQQIKKYPANVTRKTITFFSNHISGLDLVKLVESSYDEIVSLGYKVIFKLHPREVKTWRENYPFLVSHPEIQVVESGSIYKLIAESNVIMGLRSTVFYEALAYPNVMIALDPKGKMSNLLDNGLAQAVNGKEELLKALKGQCVAKTESISMPVFWHPNAAQNISDFIGRIVLQ